MIFTILLWSIWMVMYEPSENKRMGDSKTKTAFETREECEVKRQELIEHMISDKTYFRQIGPDLTEMLMPFGFKVIVYWECREDYPRSITDR